MLFLNVLKASMGFNFDPDMWYLLVIFTYYIFD